MGILKEMTKMVTRMINQPGTKWTVWGSAGPGRRAGSSVPSNLTRQINKALETVDIAQAELGDVLKRSEPRVARQHAHAQLTLAYAAADTLLRQAVTITKAESTLTWSRWRQRLSRLDASRQKHLFAEMDDSGALPLGSLRVVDYGMSGPDIGDLQYGRSRPPRTPARIGLDPEKLFAAVDAADRRPGSAIVR